MMSGAKGVGKWVWERVKMKQDHKFLQWKQLLRKILENTSEKYSFVKTVFKIVFVLVLVVQNGIAHIKALFGDEAIADKDPIATAMLSDETTLNEFIATEVDKLLDDDDKYDYDDSFNPTL